METPREEFARLNREYEDAGSREYIPDLAITSGGCLSLAAVAAVIAFVVAFLGLLGLVV